MIQSPAGYQGDVRIKRYLDFYQAGYGVAMLSSGVAFSPLSLFANGEQGGWYDPSDLSTLYQDAAGTTPVTAVEQPVGLVLDKSKGLVLGSETSPALSAYITELTGTWAASGANYAFTDTVGGQVRPGVQWPSVSLTPGWYRVVVVVASITGATQIRMDGVGASDQLLTTGTNTRTVLVTVNSRPRLRLEDTSTTIGDGFAITSVSIRELPGSHLSQSTAAARPVLSARVNLLTRTEQFDNAVWSLGQLLAFGSGSTVNATTAPNGTTTADLITPNTTHAPHSIWQAAATVASGVSYTAIWHVKPNGYTKMAIVENEVTGYYTAYDASGSGSMLSQSNATGTITALADGWYRITHTSVSSGTLFRPQLFILRADYTFGSVTSSWTPNGTSGLYIWGADLRPANAGVGLPAYQRVGAATAGSSTAAGNADYDSGPEWPRYLRFDGVDDFLQSSTITPGADKAQVFAGVRKLSDAATGVLFELSDASAGTTGWIGLYAPSGASQNYAVRARGTGDNVRNYTTYASPLTNVLAASVTSTASNSADAISFKVNGANNVGVDAISTTSTGNFSSYPLYVGSRGGTSNRFNGQLYSLILRFSATNLDAATITATETWVNGKTRAF